MEDGDRHWPRSWGSRGLSGLWIQVSWWWPFLKGTPWVRLRPLC